MSNTGLRNTFCRSSSAYNMLKFPNCLVTPPHPKLSLIAKKFRQDLVSKLMLQYGIILLLFAERTLFAQIGLQESRLMRIILTFCILCFTSTSTHPQVTIRYFIDKAPWCFLKFHFKGRRFIRKCWVR